MFLRAAESYGVTKTDIFQTVDLFEGKITNQPELFFTVTIETQEGKYSTGSPPCISVGSVDVRMLHVCRKRSGCCPEDPDGSGKCGCHKG